MSFEIIAERKRKIVQAHKDDNSFDGLKDFVTFLYPDKAHFIYELLQNAEDAGASSVCFILKNNELEFHHDGRVFDDNDLDAITKIGKGTKYGKTTIGKFGVGFKSVFVFTETPEIHSGNYHFRISDLIVPEIISVKEAENSDKTVFVFPFNSLSKKVSDAIDEICKGLQELDETTLLFLKNIKRIDYLLPDGTSGSIYSRQSKELNLSEIILKSSAETDSVSKFYLKFEKEVCDITDKKHFIAAAFNVEKNQPSEGHKKKKKAVWKINPVYPGKVCVYFPAEKEFSGLRFHIHAPFASTVARDSICDTEENTMLISHIADLISEAMIEIRDRGLLDTEFLEVLPNKKDSLQQYSIIREKLLEIFQNNELVPMKNGQYSRASGIFRSSREFSDLITDEDLLFFLDEKDFFPPFWIVNPQQRNQGADLFIQDLEILEWGKKELLEGILHIDEKKLQSWLESKDNDWHQRFYEMIGKTIDEIILHWQKNEKIKNVKNLSIVKTIRHGYKKGIECYFEEGNNEDILPYVPIVSKNIFSNDTGEIPAVLSFLKIAGVRNLGKKE